MKIRKSTKKDLKEVAKLFKEESSKKPYSQKWTKKAALDKITKMFEMGNIYVVRIDNKIIGFIILAGEGKKDAYIDEFWISEKYQRQRIGKKLLEFVENECKKRKIKKITIMTNKNSGSFKFYKKLNYKPNTEDVFMQKELK